LAVPTDATLSEVDGSERATSQENSSGRAPNCQAFCWSHFQGQNQKQQQRHGCAWNAATEETTEVQKTQGRFFFAIIVAYMAKIS